MKRYSLFVTTHITLIIIASIGVYMLFERQLWFSTIAVVLIIISLSIHLYKMQMKQIEMMRRFIGSIRFYDTTQTFPTSVKNKMMQELSAELAIVLKQIQERILSEEVRHHYYENLLNKVDTAVLVTDAKGKIEWMNREATALFEQRSDLPASLLAPATSETQVIRLQKDGETIEMAISVTGFSAQGKEQLLISLKNIHSVLERTEMEAWQKLIRVLTHEIMNSITPIISVSETLSKRNAETSTPKEYQVMHQAMQTIHRRSKGLLEFVENYRRLTRLPVPQLSIVSIKELFADLQKLFPDDYIFFETPAEDNCLQIDRAQIEQVIINLLKNAKEAVTKQPRPEIKVKAIKNNTEQTVKITVEDNGDGILPDVIDKIFVPFFTTKSNGSGIGLSLCKQIMNQHEGAIHVQSRPSKGSCFTLTFLKL